MTIHISRTDSLTSLNPITHNPTHASAVPEFPQEIVCLFIDNIFEDLDKKEALASLGACALVSHCFSLPARKYLFSTIHISEEAPSLTKKLTDNTSLPALLSSRLESLLALVESGSDLKHFIREIHIEIGKNEELLHPESGLYLLLEALRFRAINLDTLWLDGCPSSPLVWYRRSYIQLTETILKLFTSVTLRTVRFAYINALPHNIFSKCSSLQSLDLIYVSFRIPTAPSQLSSPLIELRDLVVQHHIKPFCEASSHLGIDFSFLETFRMSACKNKRAYDLWDVIKPARSSIVSLDLILRADLRPDTLFRGGRIDIGALPALRELRLHASCRIHKGRDVLRSFSDVLSLLAPLTHPTNIRSISVSCRLTDEQLEWLAPHVAWRALDPTSLSKIHPDLHSLNIRLFVTAGPATYAGTNQESTFEELHQKIMEFIMPDSTSLPPTSSPLFKLEVVPC